MIFNQLGAKVLQENDANTFWHDLREQKLSWFESLKQGDALWRLSLPANCPVLNLGPQFNPVTILEWHGQERWIQGPATASTADTLFQQAMKSGGHATCFRHQGSEQFERFTRLQSNPLTAGLAFSTLIK